MYAFEPDEHCIYNYYAYFISVSINHSPFVKAVAVSKINKMAHNVYYS